MNPHDLAEHVMQIIPDGVRLVEFKYMNTRSQFLQTRNDIVSSLQTRSEAGYGIRVLFNGAWGFASSNLMTKASAEVTLQKAIRLAKAAQVRNPNVTLSNDPVIKDTIATPMKKDPFLVPSEEKIEYFLSASKLARELPEIKFANGLYTAEKIRMVFYNSEGTQIDQLVTWNGGFMMLIARGNNDTQVRKFPDDYFATLGWEHMEAARIHERIPEIAKETVALLSAPTMSEEKTTIILDPAQLGLQLHESCGHPTELDRALGYEAAYAGTSFLTPPLLKQKFMYGNELVTIHADATIPGGLGSFPYDHEGVKGKNTPLVKNGEFVGYLTSRETAPLIGLEESGGTMRSSSFTKIPLIRMTNIVLQPGDWELEEMIQDTKHGYLMQTNRSWSIDDIRLNFQFGVEVTYKIENGEITDLIKNGTYTGITPEFWNSVSAVANEKHMKILGTPFCGKGQPGQTMFTGHGGPYTRFDNVRVGIMK